MIRNVGLILLAVLLFCLSLGWLGILQIPGLLLGILGFATGILILIGR